MRNEVNRAHKAKTTLRYLLILIGLVSVLSVSAQTLAQQPETHMQSTSVMVSSGSALPQAAVTGVMVTGSEIGSYSPAKSSKPKREVGGGGTTEDEDEPDGPEEPFPVGDAMWPLMLLALMYVGVRAFRRRRA